MAKVEVKMPQMGESITEGTIITWHKQPGATIQQDETLLEIGTDKVDTDVPAPEAGVLAEILVPEGETVDVGTTIAIIETEVGAAVEVPASAPPGDTTSEAAGEPPASSSGGDGAAAAAAVEVSGDTGVSDADGGEIVDVVMPKMGESIIEGTIITWHKKTGDRVELDETLLEIATDKVDTEVPSPSAGIVREILAEEGATLEVGTVIARIGASMAGAKPAAPSPAAPHAVAETPSPEKAALAGGDGAPLAETDAGARVMRTAPDGRFLSPLVRSIAQKEGLSTQELAAISGSGHAGRVTKKDVMDYLERRTSQPVDVPVATQVTPEPLITAGSGRTEIIQMDRMRQIIAQHMIESKRTSAHVTSFAEVDVTGLVGLRELRKEEFQEREGVKLTFTPFFVKAAVEALRDHPILNSSVEGNNIVVKKDIHVGIAVAIGKTGLVVPVIRNAGDKSIAGLARTAAVLAERARSKQLQPDDLQGGTFTVTNIGSLGSVMGTPIIPQPQVAILATGAIKKRPVVIEDPDVGDAIAIRSMMYMSLSYDHRIIDGAMASSFLQRMILELESYNVDSEI